MQRHPATLMLKTTRYLRLMQAAAVAVGHIPHGLPRSIFRLTVQQLPGNRVQCPSRPATILNQLQRHLAALGEDAETVLGEGQLLPHPSS